MNEDARAHGVRAEKARLRAAAQARRATIAPEAARAAALAVRERVLAAGIVPAGAVVSGFWPIRGEFDPRPTLEALAARGHCLCLPVVVAKGRGAKALAIRELAGEFDKPILEYPALARAVYYTSREGQQIRDDLTDLGLEGATSLDRLGLFETVINAITLLLSAFAVIALIASGDAALPTFSCAMLGYRKRRYRLEYSVTRWS